MVFINQSTQNRESRARQTKLDLDEGELLGLEDKPIAIIKDVQSDVHDADRGNRKSAAGWLSAQMWVSDRPNISQKPEHWSVGSEFDGPGERSHAARSMGRFGNVGPVTFCCQTAGEDGRPTPR